MIKLSERLERVVHLIPGQSTLADIGSDHAYLPIYAAKQGIIKKAIAGEVAEGPFQAAERNVQKEGLSDVIDVRKGDGLAVIHDDDHVECITIAGMGGSLISSILDHGKDKLLHTNRLILQPNIAAHFIRRWLTDKGWIIAEEQIFEEDGHIYEIIAADKDTKTPLLPLTDKEIFFGPLLLKEKNDAFKKKWSSEKNEWFRIYRELEKADQNENIELKKEELIKYIQWYKEELGD